MSDQHVEVTSNITLVTTTETPVAVFTFGSAVATPSNPGPPNVAPTMISGTMEVTTGTGALGLNIRVRAGVGITGAVIGNADGPTVAAGSAYSIPFRKLDPVGAVSYTVTVQQVAASANGQVYGSFDADQNLTGLI